VRISNF